MYISKANQMLRIDLLIRLYYAGRRTDFNTNCINLRPHLEYGNLIWAPHLTQKRQSAAVEKVQHRATQF